MYVLNPRVGPYIGPFCCILTAPDAGGDANEPRAKTLEDPLGTVGDI